MDLHAYDRRHGWRGKLPNILEQNPGTLEKYQDEDWRGYAAQRAITYTGLVTAVEPTFATIKIGTYHAMLTPADFAWTGDKSPKQILTVGDLVCVSMKEVSGFTVRVQLEQEPAAQAALLAIDNATGEIKAMVGGYDFEESKFNRATQALRQTGSSFKVYVYADALAGGHESPFDTIVDEPVTFPQRRPELFAEELRREIRGADYAAARARGFAQRAGGASAGPRGGTECDRPGAKIRDHQPAAAVFAAGARCGGSHADGAHFGFHCVSPTMAFTSSRITFKPRDFL